VLTAFQNALWQLLHASGFQEGIVNTVMRGGDTDTNACICGALLGSVYGRGAVPEQWVSTLLNSHLRKATPAYIIPDLSASGLYAGCEAGWGLRQSRRCMLGSKLVQLAGVLWELGSGIAMLMMTVYCATRAPRLSGRVAE